MAWLLNAELASPEENCYDAHNHYDFSIAASCLHLPAISAIQH
jgi:hypothetical protein